ncbi:DUF1889 family protein [Salmonella enterica subsp. enterica serovar Typhimurium var. 5-]|nr:DUF1889 family protein [Salmonella enterica subsp. enterica serovar Typhimurium var. 5-]
MALNEGQIVTLAVDEIIDTISAITPMAQKAKKYTPPAASMQRSSNTIWMPVEQEGWNPEFTKKVAGWAEKVASGNRILIKNPEYFSTYMQEQLKELV